MPLPPPTLRNVTLAHLRDVARLLALHQQAIACGWLTGGEAAQLNVVAAAVHARQVGDAPCRLFVALLRDQRWEVMTQEDEDQARALLRVARDGPPRRCVPEACAPEPEAALSTDARFVLRTQQVLRQAGWQGEPFLGVKLVDPTWTRARWEQAQAALAPWQQRQERARGQGSGLEALKDAYNEGCDGLSARRMAVGWTYREPSLGCHERRAYTRNAWRDFTPSSTRSACYHSNDVERYRRSRVAGIDR